MKTLTKLFVLAALPLMFAVTANGQGGSGTPGVTASASIEATIVAPLTITKEVDLNFGNLAVSAIGGTVTLAPILAATRSQVGGVTFPVTPGTVTAAEFSVTGLADEVYSIELPSVDHIITNTTGTGGEVMTVNNFKSTPSALLGGQLNSSGAETIYVGADVIVLANQAAGVYQSNGPGTAATDDFTVYICYN